jgi:hypothetical protein
VKVAPTEKERRQRKGYFLQALKATLKAFRAYKNPERRVTIASPIKTSFPMGEAMNLPHNSASISIPVFLPKNF